MRTKQYDPQKDWRERTSTAVVSIVIMIVSLAVFVIGASMLFTWLSYKETDKKLQAEETQVIQRIEEHYNLTANETSKCIQIKQDTSTGRKWYIVSINGRVFKAEYHIEDGINIYNVEEVEI